MLQQPLDAYLLMNVEPELDCAYGAAALRALMDAKLVVCLTTFASETQRQYADVLLPVAPFTENEGSYVNCEAQMQTFTAATVPGQDARPAWKVLRVLANLLGLPNFNYQSIADIQQELQPKIIDLLRLSSQQWILPQSVTMNAPTTLQLFNYWPLYRGDAVVRRASALQKTIKVHDKSVRINSRLAEQLHLENCKTVLVKQAGSKIKLPLIIDNCIADNTVCIPLGNEEVTGVMNAYEEVELEK